MMCPKVSVVIAAFNAARTLPTALRSVLDQSVPPYEVIVCDDASTDDTVSVVSAISDPRIRILRNEQNLGPGASRDRAIDAADGEWIALLDADDAWRPYRLERLLHAASESTDTMVFDDIMTCHDVQGQLVPWRPVHGAAAFNTLATKPSDVSLPDYIRSPRLLIKPLIPLAAIREDRIRHSDRRFGEDAEFFIKAGLAGIRLRYVPEPMYLYRTTPGSLTSSARDPSLMRRCLEDCLRLDDMTEEVKAALLSKCAALRINEQMYALAASVRHGRLLSALRILKSCPALWPILPRRAASHLSYQIHRLRHSGNKWH